MPVTVHDSTHVLDKLCNNKMELAIWEHTTDTAGATEVIFALFDRLGYRFTPRLRDLSDRRQFTSGPLDMQRILAWWDELLRVAGSLKLGWVTAPLLVHKLQAYPRKNAQNMVLQEYGRLVRSLPIMR